MLGNIGESEARLRAACGGSYIDLLPLAFRKDGRAIYPIMGGAEEEDEGDDQEKEDPDTDPAGGGEKDKDKEKTDLDPDARIRALEDEKNRHYSKRTEAETARDAALARLKEIEDKDKSELQLTQGERDELKAVNEELSSNVRTQAIKLAALTSANISWHDPADALMHIMRDEAVSSLKVTGGEVDATVVKAAAERLAAAKPYLVKATEGEPDDEDKGTKDKKDKKGPSGGGLAGDRKDKPTSADRAKLVGKYPALAR